MKEIYVSTDVEADGPIPGPNSMLSFGSAAYTAEGELVSTFEANLESLPDAVPDPDTMRWFREEAPEALAAATCNQQSPEAAMLNYVSWLEKLPGKPVFVAYPAGYDFLWMYWYLVKFTGKRPFSHAALDIKSYAMAMLRRDFRSCSKRSFPERWFPKDLPHTHVALDDAKEQGVLFCNMLRENLSR